MGKNCLITGATDGIGLEAAKAMAEKGYDIYLHGRNAEKGRRAVEQVQAVGGGNKVEFVQADFASLDDVQRLAEDLNARLDKLDVLINNAGRASASSIEYSRDGYEMTFAVNHLAHFLLTNRLLEKLKQAPGARIVNVSSIGHKFAPFDIDDLMSENTRPSNAYFRAKFANILFSNEFARRLEGTGVTSNALHPGTIRSNFGKESLATRIFYTVAKPFLKSPEKGARNLVYLATSAEVEGETGGYYANCKPATPAPETNDPVLAGQLWEKSEALVRKAGYSLT
jgi:NAD(P)-dependent dehydrogenase (short-subunit alcohol dehydrogenase family)